MNISKFPLLSEKLLTYSALNGVMGLALVEELPVSLVQEALSATHNIAENKHFESHAWMKRALFLNGLLNDLPLAEYYVSLGSRNVHIDNLPGYLHNTFGRKMRAVQAPQRRGRPIVYAAQDATVLLLWFVKHDMLLKFFNSIKTMFATRTPDDTVTMQAVQNVLMLAWDATVREHTIDNTLPWEWHSTMVMHTFFEKLKTVNTYECIGKHKTQDSLS